MSKHELVHHIDGDKTNNHPNNLFICKSKAHHRDIHTDLESLSMSLVKAGIIKFNHETEKYYLPQLEEILAAYSVNSEEPYVLEIDERPCARETRKGTREFDSLGNMAILSQADPRSEGATTIELSSRVQANSKRGES